MQKKNKLLRKIIRFTSIITVCLIIFSCTGCWDKIEIENRLIVLGLGIDKYDNPKDPKNKYLISYTIPNAGGSSQGGSSQSQAGSSKSYNVSTIGPSFFEANRELTTRVDKDLFYGDTKTIVFGKSILQDKDLFKYMIDVILRQDQFSKTATYAACDGKAKDIITFTPEGNPFVGRYVASILGRESSNLRYVDGQGARILKDLISTGNTIIPKIAIGKKDIKASGSYLIKNYKYCGELNGDEVRGIIMLRNDVTQGVISSNDKNESIVYEMRSLKSEKKVNINNKEISVLFNINTEGDIAQYYNKTGAGKNLKIYDFQKKISQKIKNDIDKSVNIIQQKYKLDVIGIGDYISKHYPDKWDYIKNDWNEIFSKIKIKVNVKSLVKSVGTVKIS